MTSTMISPSYSIYLNHPLKKEKWNVTDLFFLKNIFTDYPIVLRLRKKTKAKNVEPRWIEKRIVIGHDVQVDSAPVRLPAVRG